MESIEIAGACAHLLPPVLSSRSIREEIIERVGILGGAGELYGFKRELSLTDFFLAWRVTIKRVSSSQFSYALDV